MREASFKMPLIALKSRHSESFLAPMSRASLHNTAYLARPAIGSVAAQRAYFTRANDSFEATRQQRRMPPRRQQRHDTLSRH